MPPAHPAKHDRRAICALFAVFALMVQALMPTMAMAARPDLAEASIICTGTGVHTLTPDGKLAPAHKQAFGGMPCQDCLAAAMAAVTPAPVAVQRVAYETARVDHAPVVRLLQPRARAPPRPPGQGPPTA